MNLICAYCKNEKDEDAFHRDLSRKTGRRARCKECISRYMSVYVSNNKDKRKSYIRKYSEENREKLREKSRLYREAHRGEIRARNKAWYKEHPDFERAKSQKKRARKRGASIEKFSDIEIFERDKWICQICQKKVSKRFLWPHPQSPSLDHIIPLASPNNGEHSRKNTCLAHLRCNIKKGDGHATQQQWLL